MRIQFQHFSSRFFILIMTVFFAVIVLSFFVSASKVGGFQTNHVANASIASFNSIPSPNAIINTNALSTALYLPLIFHNYVTPSWAFIGLENVNVATLEIDPLLPDTIYAGSYNQGLWRTQDGGQSWEILSNGIPTTYSIRHIATAPTTPTTIYASVDNSFHWLYRSLDGGNQWEALTPPASLRIFSLGVNPITPTIIYAGIGILDMPNYGGHVMRSVDGGMSWEQVLPYYTLANKIVIDPQNPHIVYVASSSEGVLKSLDNGDTWQVMNEGLPNNPSATQLVLDSDDPLFIYLSGTGGLYNSIDGGGNWVNISQSLPQNYYSDFIFNSNTNTIFIATRSSSQPNPNCQGNMYRSSNNGANWQYIINNPHNFCAKEISFISNDFYYSVLMLIDNYDNTQIWHLSDISP